MCLRYWLRFTSRLYFFFYTFDSPYDLIKLNFLILNLSDKIVVTILIKYFSSTVELRNRLKQILIQKVQIIPLTTKETNNNLIVTKLHKYVVINPDIIIMERYLKYFIKYSVTLRLNT